jgi:hypothetical protein
VALALFGAAVYEAAVALEWIPMGHEPGGDPPGQAVATIAAFSAFVTGIVAAAYVTLSGRLSSSAFLVPIAAAAYLVAHYYAFDTYYLPAYRRYSDGGGVAAEWIYGVVLCALGVAFLIRIRPRVGLGLMPLMLFVCAISVVGLGLGH